MASLLEKVRTLVSANLHGIVDALPRPNDHIRRLRELLPHAAIYSMYGLTECKRVSYMPPDQIDNVDGLLDQFFAIQRRRE